MVQQGIQNTETLIDDFLKELKRFKKKYKKQPWTEIGALRLIHKDLREIKEGLTGGSGGKGKSSSKDKEITNDMIRIKQKYNTESKETIKLQNKQQKSLSNTIKVSNRLKRGMGTLQESIKKNGKLAAAVGIATAVVKTFTDAIANTANMQIQLAGEGVASAFYELTEASRNAKYSNT